MNRTIPTAANRPSLSRIIEDKPKVKKVKKVEKQPEIELIPRKDIKLPDIQQIRILRDADVYDTPALIQARLRIQELKNIPPTIASQAEVKRLRGIIADRTYKQRLATEKRRDSVPTQAITNFNYNPGEEINYDMIDKVKADFTKYEGQDITIVLKLKNGDRIVKHLKYFKRNFFNDIFDGFLGKKVDSRFQIRNDLADANNIQVTPDSILTGNKTWLQTYRDSATHTCVQDSLISLLDPTKKNDKTMINKLTKLKLTFPDGMTEKNIKEEIVDKFNLPIDIKVPLPIKSLEINLKPNTSQTFRKLTLINTRPNHVQPLATAWTETKYSDYKLFIKDLIPRLSSELYSVVSSPETDAPELNFARYIFTNGIMTYLPVKSESTKKFEDQFKNHTSVVDVDGNNNESPMVEFQALDFSATPIYIKESNVPVQELDMNKAYTSYQHSFPGYLIDFEEGVFSQDQFQKIVDIHENEWTTIYWDIQILQASRLHVLFNLPERLVCPTWFIQDVLLDENTEFVIYRYEIRKSFNMTFDDSCKKEYVKLFGKTAQHPRRTTYSLNGEFKSDFYRYIQSKLDENQDKYTRLNIRQSVFEHEDPIYSISHEGLSRNVCPQILNCVSLWCFANVYKISKTVPIESIVGKTLDSIILSTPILIPALFKEKLHPFFNKSLNTELITKYTHVEFCSKKYIPEIKQFSRFQRYQHVNEDIGAGGCGKTYYRMQQTPNGILALPTHELIDDKRKEFPNRIIITHHQLAGWGCTKRENVRVAYIDELTTITQHQKDDIADKHPNATMFFMGDIDSVTGIPFQMYSTLSTYKIENPHLHIIDYRSKTQATKDYKNRLRQCMQIEFLSYFYDGYSNIQDIIKEFVPETHEFNPSYPILTATRWCSDYYEPKTVKSLNCHRVQGKTLTDIFQIDLTSMSHQAFYTCISRATDISNIRFIAASNKTDDRWKFRNEFLEKLIEK